MIKMKKSISLFLISVCVFAMFLAGCAHRQSEKVPESSSSAEPENETPQVMYVKAGGTTFSASLEDNDGAAALAEMLERQPVTIQMRDYGGFEKVGALGETLPAQDSQMTAGPGDIMLYQSDQIVMFYGSNSWSYTRLGHIDDLKGWEQALGTGDVTVTLSLEK